VGQTTSAQSVQASGTTGQTCQTSGPYRSSRNARVTVFIKSGQRFPPDTDGKATTWTLVS
jgi:hypothetical protein